METKTTEAKQAKIQDCSPHDCIADLLTRQIDGLRSELSAMTQSGIIEVAVRNPSIAEYMRHWEGRATKAEAQVATQAARIAELERLVQLTGPPDGKIDVVALVTDLADKGLLSKALLIVREQRTAAELALSQSYGTIAKLNLDCSNLLSALSQAKDVLKELVACKDLRDRMDNEASTQNYDLLRREYQTRKTATWAAARQFLSTPERA